ncbi:MAG: iron-sulfur cluster assembly scaffold protein, partial [Microgenomates group bacterium]
MQNLYTKQTLKHFHSPHNFGEIKNADAIGEAGNIVCGDVMTLYLKIDKNKEGEEVIKDIKFKTYGCVAAIATSSVITDLVKGKTIDEALKINKETIVQTLNGLPPIKIHCSVLATEALAEAIYQYLLKKKKPIPPDLQKKHEIIQKSKNIIEER